MSRGDVRSPWRVTLVGIHCHPRGYVLVVFITLYTVYCYEEDDYCSVTFVSRTLDIIKFGITETTYFGHVVGSWWPIWWSHVVLPGLRSLLLSSECPAFGFRSPSPQVVARIWAPAAMPGRLWCWGSNGFSQLGSQGFELPPDSNTNPSKRSWWAPWEASSTIEVRKFLE